MLPLGKRALSSSSTSSLREGSTDAGRAPEKDDGAADGAGAGAGVGGVLWVSQAAMRERARSEVRSIMRGMMTEGGR